MMIHILRPVPIPQGYADTLHCLYSDIYIAAFSMTLLTCVDITDHFLSSPSSFRSGLFGTCSPLALDLDMRICRISTLDIHRTLGIPPPCI
ncbi:hypothetical protein BC835DRAFT_1367182 [Cytidiella melzeri]|nr:hypothetical protein BC835DRAFT_1367182 [Cytidiella melzeri]